MDAVVACRLVANSSIRVPNEEEGAVHYPGTIMATTGRACAAAGSSTFSSSSPSSMKQLHALHSRSCRNPPSMPPSHAPKLGSLVFFYYLPSRLNPVSFPTQRLPLSPPLCGHGELEIVSVKELADGFLHLSFGPPAPQNTNKVESLSSSAGEHVAQKLAVPCRLPSKFLKRSPIPVVAVRWRRQGNSSSKEGQAEALPATVKEPEKQLSRPKSVFVKRSPIPQKKNVSLGAGHVSKAAAIHENSTSMPAKKNSKSVKTPMRPRSVFVRKSPIPSLVANHNGRQPVLSTRSSDSLQDKVVDSAVAADVTSNASKANRPKSVFSRRSPIVKTLQLTPQISSTKGKSSITEGSCKTSIKADDNGGKSSRKADEDSSPGTSPISSEMSVSSRLPHQTVHLDKCKLPELRNLAKSKGVRGYSKLKKGELLDLLKNLDG